MTILTEYFDDLNAELGATRRLLERFPDAHADFKPHEKSMPLAALAAHVAQLPSFAERMLATDEIDMAATPHEPSRARTAAELVALHDRSAASVRAALEGVAPARLNETWTLRAGDAIILRDRRGRLLRQTLVSHVAHHRGQLTVYYRLLGVPLPWTYGPTADGAWTPPADTD
jgi:uncharacterized damage-inducible protein DinB